MIRLLTQADYTISMELVKERPAENLFLISDIETYGFEEDFQQVWGDFTEDGTLRAILLQYEGNFIPYGSSDFDAKGFADIFSTSEKAIMLSGLDFITSKMLPYIHVPLQDTRKLFYAKCSDPSMLQSSEHPNIKMATVDEVDRICELYSQIKEFSRPSSPEERKRSMEKGVSRTYYVEENGEMVSAVSTAAENNYSAMIVGVCTLDSHKRKGLASQCLSKLCGDLLSEGKSLCLFYDNPEAGRIYKRLGFEDMDRWTMTMLG